MLIVPFACDPHPPAGKLPSERRDLAIINLALCCILTSIFLLGITAFLRDFWLGTEEWMWLRPTLALHGFFKPLGWLIHANVYHLTANLLILFAFGNVANRSLGHWRYVLLIIAVGIGGGVVHGFFSDQPVVGASAVAFACFAYVLTIAPTLQIRCTYWVIVKWGIVRLPVFAVAVFLVVGQGMLMLLEAGESIAFAAHGFGLVFGAIIGAVARTRRVRG